MSSKVMGGGSGVATIACTRIAASLSDEFKIGEAGTTGLVDPSTCLGSMLDEGEPRTLDSADMSAVDVSDVNHWGKS